MAVGASVCLIMQISYYNYKTYPPHTYLHTYTHKLSASYLRTCVLAYLPEPEPTVVAASCIALLDIDAEKEWRRPKQVHRDHYRSDPVICLLGLKGWGSYIKVPASLACLFCLPTR